MIYYMCASLLMHQATRPYKYCDFKGMMRVNTSQDLGKNCSVRRKTPVTICTRDSHQYY